MKDIYRLVLQAGQIIAIKATNGYLFIRGKYKETKERKEYEKGLEAVMKDYNSLISDIKIRTPSETLNQIDEGCFPDSLPGV